MQRLRAGDIRALARAVSLVENASPESTEILSACFPHTGHALRVGITGAPGAGKSTLVDHLTHAWRATGSRIGVIAVDPSSPFTGGALLGDRIRIRERANDDGLYVRSMATRGSLGGLATTTADVAQVIEASGRDVLLIETVGVGQDEVEIVRLADVTVVVLVPGMGDDVQSLKAGIMEIADVFAINKADRDGADRVEKEIRAMQSLSRAAQNEWTPPVVKTTATTGEGTEALFQAIEQRRHWLAAEGRLETRRIAYWRERIEAMLRRSLLAEARTHGLTEAELQRHAQQVAAGAQDPYQLIPQLVAQFFAAR
ncbi:MAG: methylmalonyl Co-A mutase-associated GTPase MeaB [Acidobacteriaceae bacterium]